MGLIAHRPNVLAAVGEVLVLRDGQTATLAPRQEVLNRLPRASSSA